MSLIDLSRVIYDGMPKIPVLPDVHIQKCFDLAKGHPLNGNDDPVSCGDARGCPGSHCRER
jgi:hypothetical protein